MPGRRLSKVDSVQIGHVKYSEPLQASRDQFMTEILLKTRRANKRAREDEEQMNDELEESHLL